MHRCCKFGQNPSSAFLDIVNSVRGAVTHSRKQGRTHGRTGQKHYYASGVHTKSTWGRGMEKI